jgi:hypothetical protein
MMLSERQPFPVVSRQDRKERKRVSLEPFKDLSLSYNLRPIP